MGRIMSTPDKTRDSTKQPTTLDTKVIEISSGFTEVSVAGQKLQIYTQQAARKDGQRKLDVLFLHGASFTSQNWLDIQTLYHVANWGHRAVAIDLPGYGKSKAAAVAEGGDFLSHLVSALGLHKPVIVSPSMSGTFSLPYLFSDKSTIKEKATGFVPIAPSNTETFTDQYKDCELPTLIVHGTRDKSLGPESTSHLTNLPNHHLATIEDAGHACYMNKPDDFHKRLYHFLTQLS